MNQRSMHWLRERTGLLLRELLLLNPGGVCDDNNKFARWQLRSFFFSSFSSLLILLGIRASTFFLRIFFFKVDRFTDCALLQSIERCMVRRTNVRWKDAFRPSALFIINVTTITVTYWPVAASPARPSLFSSELYEDADSQHSLELQSTVDDQSSTTMLCPLRPIFHRFLHLWWTTYLQSARVVIKRLVHLHWYCNLFTVSLRHLWW